MQSQITIKTDALMLSGCCKRCFHAWTMYPLGAINDTMVKRCCLLSWWRIALHWELRDEGTAGGDNMIIQDRICCGLQGQNHDVKSSTFDLFVIQTSLTASNSTYFVYCCFIIKWIFFLGSSEVFGVRECDMHVYTRNNAVFVLEIRTCF